MMRQEDDAGSSKEESRSDASKLLQLFQTPTNLYRIRTARL
jgi:hypothetical protein